MSADALNVVLIGHGMVADTHLAALADLAPGVILRGVLGRDPGRAAQFLAERGLDARVYSDLDAVTADGAVDFALLVTPPDARAWQVAALVRAGIAILTEKPLERDLAAARAVVATAASARVPLGVVFQHRARAATRHLAARLGDGVLGELAAVEIAVPWWRPQSYYDAPGRGTYARDGGGVLINQAIHTLDLMLALTRPLTGPVASVQAMAATTRLHAMEAEDFVSAGLMFESGAVGSLVASTASYPGRGESIVLHGTKGSARLTGDGVWIDTHDGQTEALGPAPDDAETGTGGGADPMGFTHAWHRDVIADFAASLREGRPPMVPGTEALHVHALIDALTRAAASGTRVSLSPNI